MTAAELDPPTKSGTRVLQVVVVLAVVEGFVHSLDNAMRYDDYAADDT